MEEDGEEEEEENGESDCAGADGAGLDPRRPPAIGWTPSQQQGDDDPTRDLTRRDWRAEERERRER